MTPLAGFAAFLLLTLAFLGAAVATGKRELRRWHVASATCAVLCLAATIAWALQLGKLYDLESAGPITPIHHALARVTTAAYLLPLATGLWTIRDAKRRKLHRIAAYSVLAMTVVTAITGTIMLALSEPIVAGDPGN